MLRGFFIKNAQNQGRFRPSRVGRKQDFDGVVDVSAILKKGDLLASRPPKKPHFCRVGRQRHVRIALFGQKSAQHLEARFERRAGKSRAPLPAVGADGALIFLPSFWKLVSQHFFLSEKSKSAAKMADFQKK